MSKKEKIRLISLILLVGFCFAMYFSFVLYDAYLGKFFWSKHGIFFYPEDKFNDFKHALLNSNIKNLEPYERSGREIINNYFPFTYIFFSPLIIFTEAYGLALFFITTTLGLIYANYKFLRCDNTSKVETLQNVFIFSFLTYPFLFTIDRANIEGWILLMYIAFLLAYQKEKYNLSAIIIAIAAAVKFYPGMLALFFLKDKKYKQFALFVAFTTIATIGSLFLFKGGFVENLQGLILNLQTGELAFAIGFKSPILSWAHMMEVSNEQINSAENMFGVTAYMAGVKDSSSLLAFIKLIMLSMHLEETISTNAILKWYKVTSLVVGFSLLVFLIKFEDEKWKIAMCLASYFTLFIYTSFPYKLVMFFVPIWLFVNSNEKTKHDFTYCILLTLIMIPKFYLVSVRGNSVDSATILNPLIMITICAIIIETNENFKKVNLFNHIRFKLFSI